MEKVATESIEAMLSTADVVKLLKKSRQTLIRWINQGKLPATKMGGEWRFRPRDIRELMEHGTNGNKEQNS